MLKLKPVTVLAALCVLLLYSHSAFAQSPLGIGSAEPAFQTGGLFGSFFAWINQHQQSFYRALNAGLKDMRDNPWGAAWPLIGISFAYGVFHAAGPGHGKAVISSYMIANEIQLKRGIVLSFVSSLLQGLVAVLVVGAAYLVLRGTSITMTQATQFLEVASFALVAAFGAWLLFKKIRSLLARPAPVDVSCIASPGFGASSALTGARGPVKLSYRHETIGENEACAVCGNSHAADPHLLSGERFNLREAWSAIIAVGLRPCSGALIVLSFALLNGLYGAGLLSVFAMSIGTAITVSVLATMAVLAKGLALRFVKTGSTASLVTHGIEIAGALLVLVLGLTLLGAALTA